MFNMSERFVAHLANYRNSSVFNPWGQRDLEHDKDSQGPSIRRRQLQAYLHERLGRAHILLLAEAIGYQGGHFSGIPMTSERLLLGGLRHKGLEPEQVFYPSPQRTSRPDLKKEGFTEPTATIVWEFFHQQGIDPRAVILWNAFPWHPFQPGKGLLSNRTPSDQELDDGRAVLTRLLALGKFKTIVAVGRKAAVQLEIAGISAHPVRHPANGGAGLFRSQCRYILTRA
jgi:hypothetical protein